MKNELLEARKRNCFTQREAAEFLGVSLRSYKSYETENEKQNTFKYEYFIEKLNKNSFIDEEHGTLIKVLLDDITIKKYIDYVM